MPKSAQPTAREFYAANLALLAGKLHDEEAALRRFSNARLITFFIAVIVGVLAYRGLTGGWFLFALPAAAFLFLVRKHDALSKRHDHSEALFRVNKQSLDIHEDRWGNFADNGQEFRDADHPYAVDLDVFGQGSLFQWLNRTQTFAGRTSLAARLLAEPRPFAAIQADQKAIQELAPLAEWRQDFQASGMLGPLATASMEPLLAWAEKDGRWFTPFWMLVCRLLPVATVTACALAYWNQIGWGLAILLIVAQTLLFFSKAADNFRLTEEIRRHSQSIRSFAGMAAHMESSGMTAEVLVSLRETLREGESPASESIRSLGSLVEWLDVQRIPIVHLPLNAVFLYDFHFLFRLQAWKLVNGKRLRRWLEAIGEMETLASFAAVQYDHPSWTVASFIPAEAKFSAEEIGHPLIPSERRVANSVSIDKPGAVLVLTGSNMSGKSTFMRTVGVNLILAYAGAPVCATRLVTSRLDVYTSMRNTDNLEKNISSFYAELLRVRLILDAAKAGKKILFLMDEIFRGTNSADRYTGAVAVLQKLSALHAVGLVSTHDLELGRLAEHEPDRFSSYHFAEGYEGGTITFDYRLRPGVCPSRNAIPLMRMVGIIES
jgi:hypothetical protein